jgi:16S rRNA (guanine527-N7)-methyltransferase
MTEISAGRLQEAARTLLGLDLQRAQLDAFVWYGRELLAWNERYNLTAIIDPLEIEMKHFIDSLTCLKGMEPRPMGRLVDVGSGAGFPGLPLKIVCPQLHVTLVESTGKKIDFCAHIVQGLGLEGVEVLHGRAEQVGHWPEHRQSYDWGVARAVAAMPVIVEYLLPLLRVGGRLVAQRGEAAPAEAHAADGALRILGGQVERLVPIELPYVVEARYLVVVRKIAATPSQYPRRPGIPAKRPLRAATPSDTPQ